MNARTAHRVALAAALVASVALVVTTALVVSVDVAFYAGVFGTLAALGVRGWWIVKTQPTADQERARHAAEYAAQDLADHRREWH
jgi:hypothetical protein